MYPIGYAKRRLVAVYLSYVCILAQAIEYIMARKVIKLFYPIIFAVRYFESHEFIGKFDRNPLGTISH